MTDVSELNITGVYCIEVVFTKRLHMYMVLSLANLNAYQNARHNTVHVYSANQLQARRCGATG